MAAGGFQRFCFGLLQGADTLRPEGATVLEVWPQDFLKESGREFVVLLIGFVRNLGDPESVHVGQKIMLQFSSSFTIIKSEFLKSCLKQALNPQSDQRIWQRPIFSKV
jgi:hypothetical protein